MEARKINAIFDASESFALMIPKDDRGNEIALVKDIKAMPEVSSVVAYTETVGNSIPPEFLPKDTLKLLHSAEFTGIIISAKVPPESNETFVFIKQLRDTAQEHFPDQYHLAGASVSVYDMKEFILSDATLVNLISIGGIALVILLTFRSLTMPVLLLLAIQTSIYINMSVPYFTGQSIDYIGYLVISSVQLGATVDYAILFANRYIENRREMNKKEARQATIEQTTSSILTSGSILTMAGILLGTLSTDRLISQLGILLARGAALSTALVLVLLPTLLYYMDGVLQKTSLGMKLYTEPAAMLPVEGVLPKETGDAKKTGECNIPEIQEGAVS